MEFPRTAIALVIVSFLLAPALPAQSSGPPQAPAKSDRASAYYNFAMGHLYAELAGMYGNRSQYVTKAIDHLRAALKEDPNARLAVEELTELYVQSGRLKEGVEHSEALLRENPDNLNARRILGRIYTRLIGDPRQEKLQDEMVGKALEQYQYITSKEPQDLDSRLRLAWLQRVSRNSVESIQTYKKILESWPDNEDALTGLAMVYSDVGDISGAIETLKRVTEKNPSLSSLTALASAYEQIRDFENAAKVLEQASQLSPNNPEIKNALAQSLLYAGKPEQAEKLYIELSEADPKNAQFHLKLSQIYRQRRQFDKAHAALAKARELDPESLETVYQEANLLESEGKPAEAAAALRNLLDKTRRDSYSEAERNNRALFLERLGVLYRELQKSEEALRTFAELAALDSSYGTRAAMQAVETHRAAKDYKQAMREAEEAYRKYPEDRTIRMVRASALADNGRYQEGAADLRKLISGGKEDREVWLQLAQLYEKGKNYQEMAEAIDAAEKLCQSDEEREAVFFMRGAMFERMKKYDQAEEQFRKVLEWNPENASALNYLGYMLADRNVRLQEAHDLVKKALELDPDNGAYLDSQGWVYYRMDRLAEAEEYLQRALQRVSRDPVVNDHLGDVYFKQGRLKEAIVQWENSLREWEAASAAESDTNEVAKIQTKLENAKVRLAKEASAAAGAKRQ